MTQTAQQGDSVYLRAWDDYERHSLKLTASRELPVWAHGDAGSIAEGIGVSRSCYQRHRVRHRLETTAMPVTARLRMPRS